MANDIDLGESHSMLGSRMTFSGVFDGNGHTLTVHYDGIDAEGAAPFTEVGNVTIKNLHVAGLIRSSKKFAAGLVGTTWSYYTYKLVIENCRVSATVESTVSGDASNGGFIGMTGIPFTITDCLFDGQLLGETSHSTGGYVGAFASGKKGTFKNCLFAPTEIGTKMDDCRTFIREAQPENVTFENCYYITPYDGASTTAKGASSSITRRTGIPSSSWWRKPAATRKSTPSWEPMSPRYMPQATGAMCPTTAPSTATGTR